MTCLITKLSDLTAIINTAELVNKLAKEVVMCYTDNLPDTSTGRSRSDNSTNKTHVRTHGNAPDIVSPHPPCRSFHIGALSSPNNYKGHWTSHQDESCSIKLTLTSHVASHLLEFVKLFKYAYSTENIPDYNYVQYMMNV